MDDIELLKVFRESTPDTQNMLMFIVRKLPIMSSEESSKYMSDLLEHPETIRARLIEEMQRAGA